MLASSVFDTELSSFNTTLESGSGPAGHHFFPSVVQHPFAHLFELFRTACLALAKMIDRLLVKASLMKIL